MKNNVTEFCDFCDTGILEPRKITRTFTRQNRKFTYTDIDALVCSSCGQACLAGRDVEAIEADIKRKLSVLSKG